LTNTAKTALIQGATIITNSTNGNIMNNLQELSVNVIYLMGGSFILGSMFTIFILLMLDIIRSGKTGNKESE